MPTKKDPSPECCTRCARMLLPREHTRERGICHSCWADDVATQAARRPLTHNEDDVTERATEEAG